VIEIGDRDDRFDVPLVPVDASRPWRLFAGPADEPRSRRASDAIVLGAATIGVALLGAVASPPAGFERAMLRLIESVPGGLAGLWQLLVDLLTFFALVLVLAAAFRHRWAILRDVVLVLVVAVGLAYIGGRLALGSWPALWSSLRGTDLAEYFFPLRLLLPCAVVMVVLPHLAQRARQAGRLLVAFGLAAAVLLEAASPTGAVAAVVLAAASAAIVHLGFGSPRGRPSLVDVAVALRALGIDVRRLGVARRQRAGVFVVDAVAVERRRLVVKVYGRDAHDTQLLATAWRTIWYREPGAPVSPCRLQQVEHEAFLTLLAGQAGVLTDAVVIAGATVRGDVLLVLQPVGRSLAALATPWPAATSATVWRTLLRLHRTGIAHGQVDDQHLVVHGDEIGLIDFRGATVAPTEERWRTDEAQALVTTVLELGVTGATQLAVAALGADGVAAVLPYVQPPALTGRQRAQVRDAGLDLDDLRGRAAERAGVEPPELQQLRRVTWRSALQTALLVVAFFALATAIGGLDLYDLWTQLQGAAWWFVIVGVILAQATRLAQAVSTLGAAPSPLPLGPVYALQLATSYIALAIPSYAARIAVTIRFFQRHGLAAGTALALGGLDSITQFAVQVMLLGGILLLTPVSLELDLDGAAPTGLVRLVVIIVVGAAVAIAVVLIVPALRRTLWAWIKRLLADAVSAVRGLCSPRRLGMLIGGNLANELLFATALWAFVRALGYSVGLAELLVINISLSLLSGLIPIPGGIGVVEGGLTFGLVRAGLPEETAFAAVLLYRLATFYLPPVWGYFALRWLERNKHL
jgi:uncharacterized membrane protein YbhN (UPF0104 family)